MYTQRLLADQLLDRQIATARGSLTFPNLTISYPVPPGSTAQVMYASEQSEAIFPIRMQSLSVVFNSINRDKNPEDIGFERLHVGGKLLRYR